MNETLLRELIPAVTGILVRRGADLAAAEDAVQEALVQAVATWPENPPADPKGWLITAAWRKFLDITRADSSRRARETWVAAGPPPGPAGSTAGGAAETLRLYFLCDFLCAHPSLTPASAVALTLRPSVPSAAKGETGQEAGQTLTLHNVHYRQSRHWSVIRCWQAARSATQLPALPRACQFPGGG